MRRRFLLLLLLIPLFFLACEGEGHKPNAPEVRRASIEDEAARDDDNDKRAEIRTAARELINRTFPDWKLNGLESHRYVENNYSAVADISKGDERKTVYVSVILFVDDEGHTYWKVDHMTGDGEQKLPGYVIRPYQQ